MSNFVNLTGQRFGKLVVVKRVKDYIRPKDNKGRPKYLCKCDCGNYKEKIVNNKKKRIIFGNDSWEDKIIFKNLSLSNTDNNLLLKTLSVFAPLESYSINSVPFGKLDIHKNSSNNSGERFLISSILIFLLASLGDIFPSIIYLTTSSANLL